MTTNYKAGSSDVEEFFVRKELVLRSRRYYTGAGFNGMSGADPNVGGNTPLIVTYSGPGEWKQVRAGPFRAHGIKTDGTLWGWGLNGSGEVGNNATATVNSPASTAGTQNWKEVAAIGPGTYGIKNDGTLWSWGGNDKGQLGDGSTTNRSSPGTTAGGGANWKVLGGHGNGGMAIKSDGTLWTWGNNWTGQLGDGTFNDRSSPGTTAGGGTTWKFPCYNTFGYHTGAIKTDGTLWMWGSNGSGELGDGTTDFRTSPVTTAGGGTNWAFVGAGTDFSAAVKTDGTLWTWGNGGEGRLGSGATTSRTSPVTVAGGGTTWKTVNCSGDACYAIKTDGTAWAWGQNEWGELGDGTEGTANNRSSPVSMLGGVTTWKEFYGGAYGTVGLATYDW